MQLIIEKTFNSKRFGMMRTGMGPITVPESYGKDLVRQGLARVHVPRDMERAPMNAAVPAPPRTASTPVDPPSADPRQPGQAGGSATSSSGRRQGGGSARRS